jgi:hypothetical protein
MSQPSLPSSRAIRAPARLERPQGAQLRARAGAAHVVRRLLAAAAAATLVACSAALPQQGPPPAKAPSTVAEALAQLHRAEAQLDGVVPTATATATAQAGTPFANAPQPTPEPPAAPGGGTARQEPPEERGADDRDAMQLSQDPCVTACRALSSMGRAATHVCGLAGDGDSRCRDARARVDRATQRVRRACPACRS